jgi:hypothetical protein
MGIGLRAGRLGLGVGTAVGGSGEESSGKAWGGGGAALCDNRGATASPYDGLALK